VPDCFLASLLTWSRRRWIAAVGGTLAAFLLLGLTTAVIPNPVFGRSIEPTDWAMKVLILTSALSGLLFATYVRNEPGPVHAERADSVAKGGAVGGLLTYFAIGCPVCNKLVLLALGTTGAVEFFAPVQPYLGVAGLGILGVALIYRLRRESVCGLTQSQPSQQAPDTDSEERYALARELQWAVGARQGSGPLERSGDSRLDPPL